MILTAKEVQRKALWDGITNLLSQCSEEENAFFQKFNIGPIEKEDISFLSDLYELCRRTVLHKEKV